MALEGSYQCLTAAFSRLLTMVALTLGHLDSQTENSKVQFLLFFVFCFLQEVE